MGAESLSLRKSNDPTHRVASIGSVSDFGWWQRASDRCVTAFEGEQRNVSVGWIHGGRGNSQTVSVETSSNQRKIDLHKFREVSNEIPSADSVGVLPAHAVFIPAKSYEHPSFLVVVKNRELGEKYKRELSEANQTLGAS